MKSQQSGFAHAFLIIGLMVALVGALGFVFWQNFIYKEPVQTKTEVITKNADEKTKEEKPLSDAEKVAATKSGIVKAMVKENYEGLDTYMTDPIDGAVSHSDGIFEDVAPDKMVGYLYNRHNNGASINWYSWSFSDFEDVTNEDLKTQAANTTFFDFDGSYVGIGKPSEPNMADSFIAFKINSKGLITYVFYGVIVGY